MTDTFIMCLNNIRNVYNRNKDELYENKADYTTQIILYPKLDML